MHRHYRVLPSVSNLFPSEDDDKVTERKILCYTQVNNNDVQLWKQFFVFELTLRSTASVWFKMGKM